MDGPNQIKLQQINPTLTKPNSTEPDQTWPNLTLAKPNQNSPNQTFFEFPSNKMKFFLVFYLNDILIKSAWKACYNILIKSTKKHASAAQLLYIHVLFHFFPEMQTLYI